MLDSKRYKIVFPPEYDERYRKQYKDLSYNPPAIYRYVSRYSKTRTIEDIDGSNYHERYNHVDIPEVNEDKYHRVENVTENRMDIVAFNYYGFPMYWWVIAMANTVIDPFDIPYGTVLRVPPLSSIYLKGSVLGNG